MNKKILIILLTFVYSLSFYMHGNISVKAQRSLMQDYDIENSHGIYDVDEKKLIEEIPDSNIKLYYVQHDKNKGEYSGFILQINDVKKYFRWENVDNPSRKPKLILSDLDNDGKNELIIILNKGYGTGVKDEEVHVIKQELFFYEVLIENPLIPLHKKVRIVKSNEQVTIILNNKKTVLNKKGMTLLPYEDLGAGYGHYIGFEVNNNVLCARVLLGVGTNPGVGEFVLKYKYKDEIFQVQTIDFIPNPVYLNK